MNSLAFGPLRQRAASAYHHLPRLHTSSLRAYASIHSLHPLPTSTQQPPLSSTVAPEPPSQLASLEGAGPKPSPARPEKKRPQLRATKAALNLTPSAVQRLRQLVSGPTPQLIRIGVRNKGCAGMAYHLEYVEKPGKFDEVVTQDGVKVLIDSKALFSIIGSEMHWQEDRLSSKFIFKNPNIVDACGCGESFNVAA
ncbi:hypothetical protein BOTBODRAFT_62212 [Botryobasidium botryosum FD-172 SS1]|uniref:Iron-sulfur assembly protein 1 n=1 Tax=Botryobasidium botryosum (strain FD-172 SS1) TaxID=930990 RepID=A0A067MW29_BOTB1|nr:hypothetical protein BOTBODRAFT_62212 [Botryobasidium botryosum FD-172 SS1]